MTYYLTSHREKSHHCILEMIVKDGVLRVRGNIHRQSGRHFDLQNVRQPKPTAFVW